jgi:hypothetical protein
VDDVFSREIETIFLLKIMPITSSKISGAGGYFAVPGSAPPKAGAFVPKKPSNKSNKLLIQEDNIFGDNQKEKTSQLD